MTVKNESLSGSSYWRQVVDTYREEETKADPTLNYRKYENDIIGFIKDEFDETPDPLQIPVLLSIQDNPQTICKSGRGVGKTFIAARATLWFLVTRSDSVIITSAPTERQVINVLWRGEIRKAIRKGKTLKNILEVTETRLNIKGRTEWYALGVSSNRPENLQGPHGKSILLVLDEAPGIEEDIIQASMGMLTTDYKVFFIGNPTKNYGTFYDCFHSNKDQWERFTLNSEESPRVGETWINNRRLDWGTNTPIYQAYVLGEFPIQAENQLISLAWVEWAEDKDKWFDTFQDFVPTMRIIAVDVATTGNDLTVIIVIDYDKVRGMYKVVHIEHHHDNDPMAVTGKVIFAYNLFNGEKIYVDSIGVGEGVEARLKEQHYPVEGIKVSWRPTEKPDLYKNLKSQGYWNLRKLFDNKRIALEVTNSTLSGQLTAIEFNINKSDGLIRIDDPPKSPDFADCYDEATEVLTKEGFKLFKDITKEDEIATLDRDHRLVYQKPNDIIIQEYKGKMYHVIESKQIDLLVTPNHKMYVNKGDKRYGGFDLITASDLVGKCHTYKKDCQWNGIEQEYFTLPSLEIKYESKHAVKYKRESKNILMDIWLQFMGYFLSEGYVNYTQSTVVIACKEGNPLTNKMKECFDRMDIKYHYYPCNGFCFYNKQLAKYLEQFGKAKDKFIPLELKQLSSRQLDILFESLMEGDGSRNQYYTISERLRDDVIELCLKTNKSGNWCVKHKAGTKGTLGIANYDLYTVYIQKVQVNPSINYKDYGAHDEWVDYDGFVYCVTVPNHIIYVRRNGKTVWSGNSLMIGTIGTVYKGKSYSITTESNLRQAQLTRHRREEGKYLGLY